MSEAVAPVTLITGSRKGIGRYLAEYYLDRGHRVIGCSRNECNLNRADYEHHTLDVSSEDRVVALMKHVRDEHGRLDHLINNAGIASMNHSLLTPARTLRKVVDTNLVGSFLMCREAAKLMKGKRFGRIVNFTSVAVPLKIEGEAIYAATKASLISLTAILARELANFGITVNAIGPNPIETDLVRNVPSDKIERILARQAIERLGTFDDVANVVDFFLLERSNFITGQTIYLGGV